jgi:outer membrane protein assembly factor BamE (lipoprotein component of BamABCDE complex)
MKLIYKNIFYKFLICSLLLISLNNCAGRVSNHGVLKIEKQINTIIERKLEKAEVEALLGPPSTISAFEFNKWYYINNTMRHFAFFKSEIISHQVYEVIFNSENQVIEINSYDEKDLNKITYNDDYTETRGNRKTLLQNILKGVGTSSLNK